MKKGDGKNSVDLLTTLLAKGYITLDEVVKGADEVTIMKKVLIDIHPYEIALQKDGRWTTYVEDKTRPSGRRLIKKSTEEKLYAALMEFYGITGNDMTFAGLFDEWLEYKRRFVSVENRKKSLQPSTIRRYERDYDNYIKGTQLDRMKLGTITSVKLETALLDMIQTHQLVEKSASNVLGYISQAFEYAVRSGHLKVNPYATVDRTRVLATCPYSPPKKDEDRVYTTDEYGRLFEAVRRAEKKHKRYTPNYAIEFAILTGMRVGELSALTWDSIHDTYISIDYSEHRSDYKDKKCVYWVGEPKNGKHRRVPLTDDMRDVLNRVKLAGNPTPEGYIFTDEDGKRHTGHDIGCACIRRGEDAEIEGEKSIHRIRRTVSSLLRNELPVETVSNLLGHTDEVNTRHYAYDTSEMALRRDALAKIVQFKRPA